MHDHRGFTDMQRHLMKWYVVPDGQVFKWTPEVCGHVWAMVQTAVPYGDVWRCHWCGTWRDPLLQLASAAAARHA